MGLLNLIGIKPTKAQLGAANVPDAYVLTSSTRQAFAGDNFPQGEDNQAQPAVHPSYRAPQYVETVDFPSIQAPQSKLASTHEARGPVNPRQTFAPYVGIPQAGNSVTQGDEELVQPTTTQDDIMVPASAGTISYPDRVRAGGTSTDNTRVARRTIWLFNRPFDKGIADRFMTGRWAQSSPLASGPISFRAPVTDSVPYAGGQGAAPGMNPVGIQPNSQRLLPNAWDDLIINPQQAAPVDASAAYGAASRASGWRAG